MNCRLSFFSPRATRVARTALLLAPLALALPAPAQRMPRTSQPGRIFFNLHGLAKKASKYTQVSLDHAMLQMAMSGAKNPGARSMLNGLRGVYVQDLKFARPGQYSMSTVAAIARQLRNPAWKVLVRSRSAREQVWVCVQRDRETITALAVVDAKPRELALVNIVGPINLSQLGSLGALGGLNLSTLQAAGHHPQLHARAAAPPRPPQPPPAPPHAPAQPAAGGGIHGPV